MPTYQGRSYKTPLDYKGRHKVPDGWAGSTPKGPHRWARAAANALTRPTSAGAKLYRARVANASWFLDEYGDDAKRPMEFRTGEKRIYSVCGIYCAAMQMQLEYGTTERDDINALFLGTWSHTYTRIWKGEEMSWTRNQEIFVRNLRTSLLTRDVTCQCCGSKIRAK